MSCLNLLNMIQIICMKGDSLVAQMVQNLLATQEIQIQSLGWGDPLEKGKATQSSILAWRIPWTTVHRVAKCRTQLSNFHFHFSLPVYSCHLFLISSASVRFILFLSFTVPIFAWNDPLVSNFLEEISSLSHSIVFLYLFALIIEDGFLIPPCYSILVVYYKAFLKAKWRREDHRCVISSSTSLWLVDGKVTGSVTGVSTTNP